MEWQRLKVKNSKPNFTKRFSRAILVYAASLRPSGPMLSDTTFQETLLEHYSSKGPENVKLATLYQCMSRLYADRHTAQHQLLRSLNNLKRDPLKMQQPKFENSRISLNKSVHEIPYMNFLTKSESSGSIKCHHMHV